MKLNNRYYILRHGQNIHQTEKKDIVYGWPDDNPPCGLTEYGKEQIKSAAKKLKNSGAEKKISVIFSSDALRTRQTAEIIAEELDSEISIYYDKRLRDINWGIFQKKPKQEVHKYYSYDEKEKFLKAPPNGENWNDCRKRITDFLLETDKKFQEKNILLVSHGDPLWLLEGWVWGKSDEELLKQKKSDSCIKTGELRELFI